MLRQISRFKTAVYRYLLELQELVVVFRPLGRELIVSLSVFLSSSIYLACRSRSGAGAAAASAAAQPFLVCSSVGLSVCPRSV